MSLNLLSMPAPIEKDLVIFDLDNTLTDTLKFWGTATCEAVELMIEQFDLDRAIIIAAIQRAPAQYRFADFGALIEWLDAEKILPITKIRRSNIPRTSQKFIYASSGSPASAR